LELELLAMEVGVEDTLAEAVRLRAELADVPAAIDVIGG